MISRVLSVPIVMTLNEKSRIEKKIIAGDKQRWFRMAQRTSNGLVWTAGTQEQPLSLSVFYFAAFLKEQIRMYLYLCIWEWHIIASGHWLVFVIFVRLSQYPWPHKACKSPF